MEPTTRRERLEQLLRLAQTYRGWHRKELAKALGRDTTKLVPESGLPKLDLLMDLAKVLDWPVEDVAHHVWSAAPTAPEAKSAESSFGSLEEQSRAAHRQGRFSEAVELARCAWNVAPSSEARAIACNREASAYDGLGRYKRALDAAQRGLGEPDVSLERRLILQSNLANAYYSLWHLVEARGTAQYLVDWFEARPPSTRLAEVVHAHALYVRGHTYRRLVTQEPQNGLLSAQRAAQDLARAQQQFVNLAQKYSDDSYRGVANTCKGGLIEVETILGTRKAPDALAEFVDALSGLVDPENYPVGDWLESYGWWCILGCNVALRHIDDERELQRNMAIFTNKADEIANRLDNWSLRERVLTMEFVRRQRFADWTGVASEWTIDKHDVRIVTGAMGRFPKFQSTGWQILESAKVVEEN